MKNRNYLRKKKIVSVMLAAILTASSFQSVYAENSAESERRASGEASLESIVADEILVVYDDAGVSDKKSEQIQKEAEESLADKEIQVTEEVAPSEDGQGTVVTADIPEDMDVEEAVEMAMEEESVVHAQPNYIYKTMENDVETVPEEGLDDTYVKKGAAYYLDNANVKAAWNAMDYGNKDEAGGEETEVTVAVLDTGCRMDHEDLVGNISDKAYDVYENEPLTASSTPNGGDVAGGSNEGHGTHVCGLIAAEANHGKGIAGVSYNATPLPVKIFDDSGEGATTATVLAGLKYCQELIESGEVENLHVINMSV